MEYTIAEVTKRYQISASTLRYYEKEELLPRIQKNGSGQREYTEEDLEWLELILCMRGTGMKISYIKKYIELYHQGDTTIEERYQMFLEQQRIIEQQRQRLDQYSQKVEHKIDYYQKKMCNQRH